MNIFISMDVGSAGVGAVLDLPYGKRGICRGTALSDCTIFFYTSFLDSVGPRKRGKGSIYWGPVK